MDISKIQKALNRHGVDGWLLYDFANRDPIAYRIVGIDGQKHTSRRWFYYIPRDGTPIALVSAVEPTRLDGVEGQIRHYRSWKELHEALSDLVTGSRQVAMSYSPKNNIPYVSTVDGGTLELVRSFGVEVVSAADLIQEFESLIGPGGYETHVAAGRAIQKIKDEAFGRVGSLLRQGKPVTEYGIQQFIVERFEEEDLDCMGQLPVVGVGPHPADPHFEPTAKNTVAIKKGDTLLIDLWAKQAKAGAIFYDITWCAFVGHDPDPEYVKIFDIVCQSRDACLQLIRDQIAAHGKCLGCDADDVARKVIEDAGYGEFYVHRTGHSIGEEVHGTGANLDNFETRDERPLEPGCCFSIEPGIYLPGKMAVRTEIDGFVLESGEVAVAGDIQKSLVLIDV